MWDSRTGDLPPSKAILVLRIFLWGVPVFIIALGALLTSRLESLWVLFVLTQIVAIVGIGYLDQRLALQQKIVWTPPQNFTE